ncbi:hypothetical protein HOK021_40020 [Streptomyces hygroscopicus]|nr:hypothetical protein HOK021_40020 [Streptomyces hygroscopicus]
MAEIVARPFWPYCRAAGVRQDVFGWGASAALLCAVPVSSVCESAARSCSFSSLSEGPDAHPVGLMGSERDGGYAEYVTAPVERVHDVTTSPLTDDQLATLPTAYGTALGMIERGRL